MDVLQPPAYPEGTVLCLGRAPHSASLWLEAVPLIKFEFLNTLFDVSHGCVAVLLAGLLSHNLGQPAPAQLADAAHIHYAVVQVLHHTGHVNSQEGQVHVHGVACQHSGAGLGDVLLQEGQHLILSLPQAGLAVSAALSEPTGCMVLPAPLIHIRQHAIRLVNGNLGSLHKGPGLLVWERAGMEWVRDRAQTMKRALTSTTFATLPSVMRQAICRQLSI